MSQLDRFVEAQEHIYPRALGELKDGAKRSHWMWFIFPQIDGLGRSDTARFYAIRDADEAELYLAHPVLGPRLLECCAALMPWTGRQAIEDILGPVDAMKLRSSMTLFAQVAKDPAPFEMVLSVFFSGDPDEATLALLRRE